MTDLIAKRELALEAKDILESKAFKAAREGLKERILTTLTTNAPSTERKLELIAELKVVDEYASEFQRLINDYNMGVRNQARTPTLQSRVPASG